MKSTDDGARSSPASAWTGLEVGGGEVVRLDCSGMRCPQPVLRLAVETAEAPPGTIVEIVGDCATFQKDVRVFCERRKKTLLGMWSDGVRTIVRIRF